MKPSPDGGDVKRMKEKQQPNNPGLIKTKIDRNKQVASATCRSTGEERNKLTLICGSRYHVMNNTCIYLRAKCPNIYMYKRGRIYKEPPGEMQ
jgi:hypothetical protein